MFCFSHIKASLCFNKGRLCFCSKMYQATSRHRHLFVHVTICFAMKYRTDTHFLGFATFLLHARADTKHCQKCNRIQILKHCVQHQGCSVGIRNCVGSFMHECTLNPEFLCITGVFLFGGNATARGTAETAQTSRPPARSATAGSASFSAMTATAPLPPPCATTTRTAPTARTRIPCSVVGRLL